MRVRTRAYTVGKLQKEAGVKTEPASKQQQKQK